MKTAFPFLFLILLSSCAGTRMEYGKDFRLNEFSIRDTWIMDENISAKVMPDMEIGDVVKLYGSDLKFNVFKGRSSCLGLMYSGDKVQTIFLGAGEEVSGCSKYKTWRGVSPGDSYDKVRNLYKTDFEYVYERENQIFIVFSADTNRVLGDSMEERMKNRKLPDRFAIAFRFDDEMKVETIMISRISDRR